MTKKWKKKDTLFQAKARGTEGGNNMGEEGKRDCG